MHMPDSPRRLPLVTCQSHSCWPAPANDCLALAIRTSTANCDLHLRSVLQLRLALADRAAAGSDPLAYCVTANRLPLVTCLEPPTAAPAQLTVLLTGSSSSPVRCYLSLNKENCTCPWVRMSTSVTTDFLFWVTQLVSPGLMRSAVPAPRRKCLLAPGPWP